MASTKRKEGPLSTECRAIKAFPGRLKAKMVAYGKEAKKIGKDDPRRIVHSLKVGLAIALVSLFYYFDPLYEGFGVSAMWAVMTVVVVFEFSVGATIGRGLNRALATIIAASLGYGAHRLASLSGEKGEPLLLGFFVFSLASAVSFLRFFPTMKARYDYGLLIFILTFSLICVSGYRDDEVLDMALTRVSTILIGGVTALAVCILICPVWAGADLHDLVAANIGKLGDFLQGFGDEFFKSTSGEGESKKADLEGYKSILNSKPVEESLVNFARWEPGHGRFRFRHPWKHYLKIGSLTRQCAYHIEALNGYLSSEVQIPEAFRGKIQEACTKMSSESGKALNELALAIRTMSSTSAATPHIIKSQNTAKNLKSLINASLCNDIDLIDMVPVVTVASLLVDVVCCIGKIAESTGELASLARFKNTVEPKQVEEKATLPDRAALRRCTTISVPHHQVITIDDQPFPIRPGIKNLSMPKMKSEMSIVACNSHLSRENAE